MFGAAPAVPAVEALSPWGFGVVWLSWCSHFVFMYVFQMKIDVNCYLTLNTMHIVLSRSYVLDLLLQRLV